MSKRWEAPEPGDINLTERSVRSQIHADMCDLLEYVGAAEACKKPLARARVLSELKKRGLVTA